MPPPGKEPPHERRQIDELTEYKLSVIRDDIVELKKNKASTESVQNIDGSVRNLKDEVVNLKRILMGAAIGWVAGSGMFLLAVLQIRGK